MYTSDYRFRVVWTDVARRILQRTPSHEDLEHPDFQALLETTRD